MEDIHDCERETEREKNIRDGEVEDEDVPCCPQTFLPQNRPNDEAVTAYCKLLNMRKLVLRRRILLGNVEFYNANLIKII